MSLARSKSVWQVAPLLFLSGLCALSYQVAWQREFRLIFGASTASSAAVLALFILGIGLGSIVLGKRADRAQNPLLMYGNLEIFIALSAGAAPFLLDLTRLIYVSLGGTEVLGVVAGTGLRLVLVALVILVPTFLMGGTLPAAARSVGRHDDAARSDVALLYGVNTLGAVAGAAATTFFLLEVFGNQRTLWIACLVNLLVALAARALSRSGAPQPAPVALQSEAVAAGPQAAPRPPTPAAPSEPEEPGTLDIASAASPKFVLLAAATVGFAFFLMEIVWYRTLGPLLGGTVFTFGLILATALLGIGVGGAFYTLLGDSRRSTYTTFGVVCLLEAAAMALPLAIGDGIALFALFLQPLGALGFATTVLSWTIICLLVVFPAAFVSGVQFPILINLLGAGKANVGEHVGKVYAWNTGGAMLGSLAGGFGFLPLFTAIGSWKLVIATMTVLGVSSLVLSKQRKGGVFAGGVLAAIAVGALFATGPTAVWRHSQIGVGRVNLDWLDSPNKATNWIREKRRSILWEEEGVESSIAIDKSTGLAFSINGKIDGHVRADAGTQVMGGLVGAALHPDPKTALVIGLGTGSTSGWLAAIPSMERVDTIELEKSVVRFAAEIGVINHDALKSPKVRISIADARETLLTTPQRYDIVFSEPSNPYRAGIASLFTQEFYESAAKRLNDDGLFLQWIQAYEVNGETVRTTLATLAQVFPTIEIWQLAVGDLLLIASKHEHPAPLDTEGLRTRLQTEPYRSAMLHSWHTDSLEGFLAHYVANAAFTTRVARQAGDLINRDDLNFVEFGFAKAIYGTAKFDYPELLRAAAEQGEHFPGVATTAGVRWEKVDLERAFLYPAWPSFHRYLSGLPPETGRKAIILQAFATGRTAEALSAWKAAPWQLESPSELLYVGAGLAAAADPAVLDIATQLENTVPIEAHALRAKYWAAAGEDEKAIAELEVSLGQYRENPWPTPKFMGSLGELAEGLALKNPGQADRIWSLIRQPFALYLHDDARLRTMIKVAANLQRYDWCDDVLREVGPHFPWQYTALSYRLECAQKHGGPAEVARAKADVGEYLAAEPESIPFLAEED
jgi:spermidine synthase